MTHKGVYTYTRPESRAPPALAAKAPALHLSCPKEDRECFYCHKVGHVMADCLVLRQKRPQPVKRQKGVGLVRTVLRPLTVELSRLSNCVTGS